MKKIIVIGGATEDISFKTSESLIINNSQDLLRQKLVAFEYGAKIQIDSVHYFFGGGAANASASLSNFGFKVWSLLAVGNDDRGKKIKTNLKKFKVNTSLIKTIKGQESGFSFVLLTKDQEKVVFSDRGANNFLTISRRDLLKIKSTDWIYLTSLSGDWFDLLQKVFSTAKAVAWNPGHIQLKAGARKILKFIKKTKVFIVNRDEALELIVSLKKKNINLKKIETLLKEIKQLGAEIVLITDGKKGAYAFDGQKIYYQPTIKEKKRVDTTGVGDSFGSAFVAGLELYKGDVKKALKLGARNSSSVIGQAGAQNGLLSKKNIKL